MEGYSLMVEQWSSKPYAWVRFLLPLTHMNLNRPSSLSYNLTQSYFNSRKYKKKFTKLKNIILIKNSTTHKSNIYFRLNNLTPAPTLSNAVFKRFHFSNLLYQKNLNFYNSQLHIFSSIFLLQNKLWETHYQLPFVWPADAITRSKISNTTQKVVQSPLTTLPASPRVATQFFKNSYIKPHRYSPNISEYYNNLQSKKDQKFVTWTQKRFKLLQINFRQHKRPVKFVSVPITLPVPQPHGFWKHRSTVTTATPNSVSISMDLLFTKIHYSPNSMKLMFKYFDVNTPIHIFNEASLAHPQTIYTNLLPCRRLTLRKISKNLQNRSEIQFRSAFLVWYNFLITRFLENFTGHKTCITFNPCLAKSLTFREKAQLLLWTQRVQGFQRMIGPKVSLLESLEITYLSLKLKEPTLLSNWLVRTIRKVSFWKYKAFFRFLKFLFNNLLLLIFKPLGVLGVKIKLKGKISVAGNARTRAIYYRVGNTSQAKIQNKILHTLNLVHTFTGVLGLQIWYYF